MGILLSGGIISVLFAFGDTDPQMPASEWLAGMVVFLLIGAACFYGLYLCNKAWEDTQDE